MTDNPTPEAAMVEEATKSEQLAGYWLALGNVASERGNDALADRHYMRSQKHLDRANEKRGW